MIRNDIGKEYSEIAEEIGRKYICLNRGGHLAIVSSEEMAAKVIQEFSLKRGVAKWP